MRKSYPTSQHGTQNEKTHNRTTQQTKTMNNGGNPCAPEG